MKYSPGEFIVLINPKPCLMVGLLGRLPMTGSENKSVPLRIFMAKHPIEGNGSIHSI